MTLAEILRKSCAANNLGTTGSSAVLLARLVKSGKKSAATAAKMPAMTSAKEETSACEAFAEPERATLIASGITKEDAINEEIDRRWSVLQSLKPASKPRTPTSNAKKLEVVLDAEQLDARP